MNSWTSPLLVMIKTKTNFNLNALGEKKEKNRNKEEKNVRKTQKYDLISTIVERERVISC